MALMVGSLYDALRSVNVADGKVDRLEQRLEARFTLLQWMLGFALATNVAILLRLFA